MLHFYVAAKKKIAFYLKVLYVFKVPSAGKGSNAGEHIKITNIGYNRMKQSSNKNRAGGRYPHFNNNRRNNLNMPTKNTVFDSSGPCGRMRGTAVQLSEKYQTAAKDARHNDAVLSEICLQYADHYQRIYALACANDKPPVVVAEPVMTEQSEAVSEKTTETPAAPEEKTAPAEEEKTESPSDTLPPHLSFMTAPIPCETEEKPVKPIRRPRKPKTAPKTETEHLSA